MIFIIVPFVRSRGWLGWASNGQKAGSVRMNLPVEGIQLTIVENDRRPRLSAKPTDDSRTSER